LDKATLVTCGWIRALKKYLSHKGLRTVPVGDDESHRVDPRFKNHLLKSTREDITTLYDLTNDSFKRYASRRCMGTRQFLGWKSPKMKHFGGVTWKSYAEVGVDAHSFGAALRVAGLVPASDRTTLEELQTPCSLAIFEDACAEWLIAALGAFSQSIIVTTVSNSLGTDGVVNAVNAGSIAAIVVNKIHVKKLVENSIKMPSLKTIIYTSNLVGPKANIEVPDSTPKVQIVAFQDFVASGGTTKIPPTPPLANTSALIMYKANAAGKGIVITHGNMVAACASGAFALGIREEEDSYISYLPPSLCIELVMELIMISRGCTICYAEPKSLTKTGSYPEGALTQFAPTVMMGFPRTWGAFMKRIQERMHQASPFGQFLVQAAMEARSFALNHGYDTPLFNALVFDKLKPVFGGKLRLAIAAPGPLWGGIRDFIHTCFGIPLIKIYVS
jgi:long-chain acyl-CoA synthetase